MLIFRAWKIRTARVEKPLPNIEIFPKMQFRHVEKLMLYLTKHVIQWIVLVVVKYWFIIYTKTKKWAGKKLPKIYEFFKDKSQNINHQKNSFVRRAILESKIKIRRIKEKVKREHGDINNQ